jgi:SAM-dependent methyltransferase
MATPGRDRLKTVARSSPPRLKRVVARAVWAPIDLYESVSGRRPDDVPPRGLRRYVGAGSFEGAREAYLHHLTDLGGLRPEDRVLDVGCGIGRMAAPLADHLTTGSYDGIDVVPEGIAWANKHLAPRHPRFRFHLCDVFNSYYNRGGTHSAATYRFPFEDRSFDFIFATSLFTHLMPDEMANYLCEIARVADAGARCFLTFFVLDDTAKELVATGRSSLAFVPDSHDPPRWWTITPRTPEAAIGFDEQVVRRAMADAGLEIVDPIAYGTWSGRDGYEAQDIVLARPAT